MLLGSVLEVTLATSTASPAQASNVGAAIVAAARGQAGYAANPSGTYCNKFSAYWGSGRADCGNANRDIAWCADFVAWAWAQAGITGLYGHGINANASSFRTWGQANGRWHPLGDGYVPQPGDAAEYSDAHVGIYTGGPANSPTVISGDWYYPDRNNGQVYEQANVTSNGAGAALSGYVAAPDTSSGGGGGLADGAFVSYQGNVYRMAGGAPIYVSNWNAVGGPQSTTSLTDSQFAALRQYPADGTFVSTPGYVWEFAGGAPIYVSNWDAVGGQHSTVGVDPYTLDHPDQGAPFNHVHQYPADGTFVGTPGYVWEFAGGAPIYVSNWDAVGGQHSTVGVDPYTLDHPDQGAPFNHVHQYPADGTFVGTPGYVWEFAGGAPIYVSNWDAVGGQHSTVGVDPYTLDHPDQGAPFNHVHQYPADGTFVGTPGYVWEFAGGAPIYVSNWDAVGGQHSTVGVDPYTLDHPDQGAPFNHVHQYPADGTLLALGSSGSTVAFHITGCTAVTPELAAVVIDPSQSPCPAPLMSPTPATGTGATLTPKPSVPSRISGLKARHKGQTWTISWAAPSGAASAMPTGFMVQIGHRRRVVTGTTHRVKFRLRQAGRYRVSVTAFNLAGKSVTSRITVTLGKSARPE